MSTDNMQEESLQTVAGDAGAQDAGDQNEATSAEDEGDVAADYLEELLDIADLDGDIDI